MRERALAKRRKAVEELLQWHKKLLEEEKAVQELEMHICTIAIQAPTQEDKMTSTESQSILEYIPERGEQQSVISANYNFDSDVKSGQLSAEKQGNISPLSEKANKVQNNILNSNVSFRSSIENSLQEENISGQIELEQSKKKVLSVTAAIPDSKQSASSVNNLVSMIIVKDPVVDTKVNKSSEGFEEANNSALSSKPEESYSVPAKDVIKEASNFSHFQESFENKSDDEKVGSVSGKSKKVLPVRARILTETFEDEDVSLDVTTVQEEDEFYSTSEPELLTKEKKTAILTEAEELHRKQLAIEQEIKLLKEQQKKEAAIPFYLRKIPDKPPPPYTPPSKNKTPKTPITPSIIPKSKEECEHIIEYCVKIIYKAYACGNLDNITISENTLKLIAKDIDKRCYKFVFDLCKEVAIDHYTQCIEVASPSWLRPERKPTLAKLKPLDSVGLMKLMQERVLTQLGFHQARPKVENSIIKWSKKNRDQVDEALVQEIQGEDVSWTNLEVDSTLVKDRMVKELMEMLVQDTASAFKEAMSKKMRNSSCSNR